MDETKIPKGGGVKIRCPRCQETEYVEDGALGKNRGKPPLPAAGSKIEKGSSVDPAKQPRSAPHAGGTSEVSEPSIPDDAFHGFRFPAERETGESSRTASSPWRKILIWGAVSLAIVIMFAILVNVILWGPASDKPFLGRKPSGAIDRPSPGH